MFYEIDVDCYMRMEVKRKTSFIIMHDEHEHGWVNENKKWTVNKWWNVMIWDVMMMNDDNEPKLRGLVDRNT